MIRCEPSRSGRLGRFGRGSGISDGSPSSEASRYLTVVLDLDSGAVVFVGEGKGAEALDPFWKRLRRSGARIEAVATDMSLAYIRAVRGHLPEATLVFDRFRCVRLFL